MKKLILSIFILLALLLLPPIFPSPVNAQAKPDCRKIFDKESYKCLTDFNACSNACLKETEKPDGSAYFNSGEIYKKCMKASDCEGKSKTCDEQALTNFRACGKSGKQPTEAKKETSTQDENPVIQVISDWTMETKVLPLEGAFMLRPNTPSFYEGFKTVTGKNLEETLNWQPIITKEAEQKAWDFGRLDTYLTEKINIIVLQGEAQLKSPTSPQFIPIVPKGGDTIQVTYLDSTMRATSDSVQLRYTWSANSGAVINVPKWSEIKFQEPVEVERFTSHRVELKQGEIEVKVRNNKPAENQFGVDAGWLGVTASRTHFWVSQSEDKKVAVIGVYEGEVEVKTKDGKTIRVTPKNGKPGVVVVSQKLSVVKLAAAGVALTVVFVGMIFILRRFLLKSFKKKK